MKKIVGIILISVSLGTSCNSTSDTSKSDNKEQTSEKETSKESDVPFKIAENYFIKNDVNDTVPSKIVSQEVFDTYFGLATTMGENGKPTPIDFSKEFVIVVDHNNTSKQTDISLVSLEKKEENILFNYAIIEGEDKGFVTRPFLMVIVDKNNDGEVIFLEQ